jgi:hypothetical protein
VGLRHHGASLRLEGRPPDSTRFPPDGVRPPCLWLSVSPDLLGGRPPPFVPALLSLHESPVFLFSRESPASSVYLALSLSRTPRERNASLYWEEPRPTCRQQCCLHRFLLSIPYFLQTSLLSKYLASMRVAVQRACFCGDGTPGGKGVGTLNRKKTWKCPILSVASLVSNGPHAARRTVRSHPSNDGRAPMSAPAPMSCETR